LNDEHKCAAPSCRDRPLGDTLFSMNLRSLDVLILDVLEGRTGLDLPQIASAARLSIGEAQDALDGSDGLVQRGLVLRSSDKRRRPMYELNRSLLQQRVRSTAA